MRGRRKREREREGEERDTEAGSEEGRKMGGQR